MVWYTLFPAGGNADFGTHNTAVHYAKAQCMQPGWAGQIESKRGSNNLLNWQTGHATNSPGQRSGCDLKHELLHRPEAYSCWSTASSARINNYGTRIDLILAAGPCGDAGRHFHASVTGGDIWMDAHGSDHAPAYADLAPSLPIAVGQRAAAAELAIPVHWWGA